MSSRNSLGGIPRLCGTLPFSLTWRFVTIRSAAVIGLVPSGPWPALTRQPRRPHPGRCGARFALSGSGGEALSAGTAVLHVGVVELESGPHQTLDVVDLGAAQQHHALEIHHQP